MAMRMREVPAWTWVGVCVPLAFVCTIFNAIYFSSITVFHDISKQIQLRARTGEIFARWPLAIAINSNKYFYRRISGIKEDKLQPRTHHKLQVFEAFLIIQLVQFLPLNFPQVYKKYPFGWNIP